MVDDRHAPADQRHLGQDVRAQQHRVVLAERADHLARLLDLPGVEAGGGLVEQQDLRRAEQRLGQAQRAAGSPCESLKISWRNTASRWQAAVTRSSSAGMAARGTPFDPRDEAQVRATRRARRRAAGARAGSRCGARPRRSAWPCRARPTITRPDVAAVNPAIMRIVVVLPAPFGPRKPTISPLLDGERQVVDDRASSRSAWRPTRGRSPAARRLTAEDEAPPAGPGRLPTRAERVTALLIPLAALGLVLIRVVRRRRARRSRGRGSSSAGGWSCCSP